MANDEPIYKFERLKSLLKSMGYRIDKAIGYKPLKIEDVDINDIRKNIKFTDKGIFVIDTDPVSVKDMDNNMQEVEIRNLPLCKYCMNMALGEYSANMTSADFVEILKRADDSYEEAQNKDIEVDIFGYTKDWTKISLAYRELHEYTCEKCGLHITNPFDQLFMQTHHKNGNKVDNRQSNLQCLCIRCHANIDARHKANFARGGNRITLEDFNTKYPQ